MAQEHLAVANDSVLRRVPREAAATDPNRTARCSVVSLRWRVRSVVPAAIASDDRPRARIATDRDSAMTPPPARPLSLERFAVAE
jgi:hypothetical protein